MADHTDTYVNAYVNLWELITTVASYQKDELPNKDKCQAIQAAAGLKSSFGTELSLEIVEGGTWAIRVFQHDIPFNEVSLLIAPSGRISIRRTVHSGETTDNHEYRF